MGTVDKLSNLGCRATVSERKKLEYIFTREVKKRGLTAHRYVHVSETESMINWQAY